MASLSRLFIYPIKSTAPLEVVSAEVTPEGLARDRRYVVTDPQGRFFTARRFPRMVLIKTELHDNGLTVSAPGVADLELDQAAFPGDAYEPVTIWQDTMQGQRCGDEADRWFSDYLERDARLYFMGERTTRPSRAGGVVSFADATPLMALGESSLDDLNTRLARPVRMRNFRPNLVVSGTESYAEDGWPDFSIGDVRFKALWRCTRCVLTTVDPDTGVKDPDGQPLATLMDYRRNDEGEACFGLNVAGSNTGRIFVGQQLVFD